MVVSDLIKGALRLIGVLATGEAPSAQEQTDSFQVLSDMLDDWSNESLLRFPPVIETFNFVSGQQTYMMGTGAPDFNTARPILVEQANWQLVGTTPQVQNPIEIITQQEWMDINVKSTPSSIPLKLFIQETYPYATLNFWPVPSVGNQLVLASQKPFSSFASVGTTVSYPPGYQKAFRYNLAIELAPEFGESPSEAVLAMAVESKANIKRTNSKPPLMKCDTALVRRSGAFNWITGE